MAENLFGKIDSRGSTPVTYNFTPLSTAEAFSTSKSYAVGDYCFYEGVLYKCKEDKTAGAWSADNFEKVTVSEELKGIVNGYHPDMTAGDAEQLVSTQYVEDKTPYLYRTTGGSSDVGNREYVRSITGGTVAWNQVVSLAKIRESRAINGVQFTKNNDGSVTLSGTATGTVSAGEWSVLGLPSNHVCVFNIIDTDSKELFWIAKYPTMSSDQGLIRVESGKTYNITYYPKCFDLTQMFGTAIADYIYSLEQATAGAGVAWFRKLFPNDYYPYNAGELKSVEGVSSHEMVGFNQFNYDGTTALIGRGSDVLKTYESTSVSKGNDGFTLTRADRNNALAIPLGKLIAGQQYKVGADFTNVEQVFLAGVYDKSALETAGNTAITDVVLRSKTNLNDIVFTPTKTADYVMTTWSNNVNPITIKNICCHLVWSGTHNGEYKPYEKHTYALDSSLTLRGIPKLDAQNGLYYDGDVYAPDGTVTRKYGIVDLGSLTWIFDTDDFYAIVPNCKSRFEGICEKYPRVDASCSLQTDKTWQNVSGNGTSIWVKDSAYTDAATFKTAMNGVYLVYELATPTTETADPYNEVQICDDWGTEEYVSTSIVPVGHTTDYPANLRDKLQHLPDLASADGNYIVSQSGTQMTLAPLPIVIPAPPTTDGTYTFRATVSNGVPTLSWVEE